MLTISNEKKGFCYVCQHVVQHKTPATTLRWKVYYKQRHVEHHPSEIRCYLG